MFPFGFPRNSSIPASVSAKLSVWVSGLRRTSQFRRRVSAKLSFGRRSPRDFRFGCPVSAGLLVRASGFAKLLNSGVRSPQDFSVPASGLRRTFRFGCPGSRRTFRSGIRSPPDFSSSGVPVSAGLFGSGVRSSPDFSVRASSFRRTFLVRASRSPPNFSVPVFWDCRRHCEPRQTRSKSIA